MKMLTLTLTGHIKQDVLKCKKCYICVTHSALGKVSLTPLDTPWKLNFAHFQVSLKMLDQVRSGLMSARHCTVLAWLCPIQLSVSAQSGSRSQPLGDTSPSPMLPPPRFTQAGEETYQKNSIRSDNPECPSGALHNLWVGFQVSLTPKRLPLCYKGQMVDVLGLSTICTQDPWSLARVAIGFLVALSRSFPQIVQFCTGKTKDFCLLA